MAPISINVRVGDAPAGGRMRGAGSIQSQTSASTFTPAVVGHLSQYVQEFSLMKQRLISTEKDAVELEQAVVRSAGNALDQIAALRDVSDVLRTLWSMKFCPIGRDPLDPDSPLNFIEQINQTFTYIASARAAKRLLEIHPEFAPFTLNLGNRPGTDIESKRGSGLACEVFAAVNPYNNGKLSKDIANVAKTDAGNKYVFFMCPGFSAGQQRHLESVRGVQVWSVGGDV